MDLPVVLFFSDMATNVAEKDEQERQLPPLTTLAFILLAAIHPLCCRSPLFSIH